MVKASLPTCHLGYVPGPNPSATSRTAVWICEYPYRTMRLDGPNAEDCGDCPLWRAMAGGRAAACDVAPEETPARQPVAV